MSVFPFIDPDVWPDDAAEAELPMFREYAYDFENNCLKLQNGKTYILDGNEAVKIWIYKALTTARYRYLAYSDDYGSEIDTLPWQSIPYDILTSELKRLTIETLMVLPYITELNNFTFSRERSGVHMEFDCITVYGATSIQYLFGGENSGQL